MRGGGPSSWTGKQTLVFLSAVPRKVWLWHVSKIPSESSRISEVLIRCLCLSASRWPCGWVWSLTPEVLHHQDLIVVTWWRREWESQGKLRQGPYGPGVRGSRKSASRSVRAGHAVWSRLRLPPPLPLELSPSGRDLHVLFPSQVNIQGLLV